VKYLPSPRILAIVFIVLGLLGLGWFWYFSPSSGKSEVYENGALTAGSVNKITADADGDGLQDWEEVLWKTDPKNPDSDGDGMPDGEEIKPEGVYPPGAAAEDSILPTGVNQQANLTEYITQAFSQSVGPRLLAGQGEVRTEEIRAIQNYFPSGGEILGPIPKVNANELHISENNSPGAVKNYFNQVYSIYEKTFLTLKEDDLMIFFDALKTENFSGLEKIDKVLDAFDESLYEVKKIPVPRGYEDFAIAELNYLLKSMRVVEVIKNAESDPLSAILASSLRLNLMNEIRKFHLATADELRKKDVVFLKDEGGYKFFE